MTDSMRVFDVDRLDCCFVAHRWRFAEAHEAEMDRFWAARVAANPALYDGPVLLASQVREETETDGARVLRMELFETRFSRFMAWRDLGWADPTVFNCFSMAAVCSSDGAFLLGEMGPGHSSAGQIYFPGGTPDREDIVAGARVDLAGSLKRELAEEAGLRVADGRLQPNWTIIAERQRIACVRRVDRPETAAALRDQVRRFIAAEKDPELSDAHFLSRPEELDDPRLPGFMVGYLAHVFAQRENAKEAEFPQHAG